MKLTKNLIDGWITSLIGVITMGLTLYLIYNGTMEFMWNGVLGLSIGTILLLAPKTIEKVLSQVVNKASNSPNNVDQNLVNPNQQD